MNITILAFQCNIPTGFYLPVIFDNKGPFWFFFIIADKGPLR